MQKTNGDVEEVITTRIQPVEGVSLSQYSIGSERPIWFGYKIGQAVVPNFQVLWLTDALTQENVIPPRYVLRVAGYGSLYIVAAISMGVVLFQRREVS